MKLPLNTLQIPLYIPEPLPELPEDANNEKPAEHYGIREERPTTIIRIPMNPDIEYDSDISKN